MTLTADQLARRLEAERCRFELTGEGYAAVLVAVLGEFMAEREAKRNERRMDQRSVSGMARSVEGRETSDSA